MSYKFLDEGKKHVHTFKGQPLYGTSTVVGILNKPLTWWAAGMSLEPLGWKNPKKSTADEIAAAAAEGFKKTKAIAETSIDAYATFLHECYYAHDTKKKDSAEAGTDMHALLEEYVTRCIARDGKPMANDVDSDAVGKFASWAFLNIEKFVFSEGHTYSEKHWVGGIVDVGAIMKDGKFALLDFKSSKEAYYSQLVQIAGYAVQIEETGVVDADGKQILPPQKVEELIVVPFGSETINTRSAQNVEIFKEAFLGALANYKLSQSFDNQ